MFLLLFIISQHEISIEKVFFLSAGAQKGWVTAGSGNTLPQYLPNPKVKFPVKFIFTLSIFALLLTHRKGKTISLRIFKAMAYLNFKAFSRHFTSWKLLHIYKFDFITYQKNLKS